LNVDDDPIKSYTVLINDEEQHSLWPDGREVPNGWREVGVRGSKSDCLAYVEKVWKDITPLSVRQQLAKSGYAAARAPENTPQTNE
jgi:MbtH protein